MANAVADNAAEVITPKGDTIHLFYYIGRLQSVCLCYVQVSQFSLMH